MKSALVLIIVAIFLLAMGCATPYKPYGTLGGYSNTPLAPDVYRVSFRGNAFTSMERAQDFVLLHAAELALTNGFPYFAIVDESSSSSTYTYVTPAHSDTSGSATFIGNHASFSAYTFYQIF